MSTDTKKIRILKYSHWILVIIFGIAWLSGDNWMQIHAYAGYGLIAFCIMFVLRRIVSGNILRRAKPALEVKWLHFSLVLLLLGILLLSGLSGIAADRSGHELWEDTHESLANLSLMLAGAHIFLVFILKLKNQTDSKNILTQRGSNIMNHSTISNGYSWLLAKWQQIKTNWINSSGNNILLRGALVVLSLSYAVLVTSLVLALLPMIMISAFLIALIMKSDRAEHNRAMTINVTPEA